MTALPIEPDDHQHPDPQRSCVVGPVPLPAATHIASSKSVPLLAESLLAIYADSLDDLEASRIAMANRLRALEQVKGMADTPEASRMRGIVDGLADLEHQIELDLKRAVRQHPLGAWIKGTVGVGEKQGARLLAAIGDPSWHSRDERPRTVSELWAYCGLHVLHSGQIGNVTHRVPAGVDSFSGSDPVTPGAQERVRSADPSDPAGQGTPGHQSANAGGVAPSRRRGQRANWNATAKMRVFLVAESCVKQRTSPYRSVYETGRLKYAAALHNRPCPRCGPAGRPAQPGSPLSLGHQHARALRLVMKAILKDLWREASNQRGAGTHDPDPS